MNNDYSFSSPEEQEAHFELTCETNLRKIMRKAEKDYEKEKLRKVGAVKTKCSYPDRNNIADFIDDADNYICGACMASDLDNNYTGQEPEDFEQLNWEKFPGNGFAKE